MNKTVYLKLVTGEEIFAELMNMTSDVVKINEPMIMETVSNDDSVKYMFLSRYSPYSLDQKMAIDRDKIIVMTDVKEEAHEHYKKSVLYAQNISDRKFLDGIKEATKYLESILDENDKKEDSTDLPAFFMVDKPTSTKH